VANAYWVFAGSRRMSMKHVRSPRARRSLYHASRRFCAVTHPKPRPVPILIDNSNSVVVAKGHLSLLALRLITRRLLSTCGFFPLTFKKKKEERAVFMPPGVCFPLPLVFRNPSCFKIRRRSWSPQGRTGRLAAIKAISVSVFVLLFAARRAAFIATILTSHHVTCDACCLAQVRER
jgi:hypothetical protein